MSNIIKIYLKESGSIAELYKDFRLYAGQYQDKLLQVYVPKSMIYESVELNTMLTNVKIGAILTNEKGGKVTTKSYAMVYTADETVGDIEYEVYEKKLPKVFCSVAGTQQLVINVENMQNGETPKVLSVITSQIANFEVQESASLDEQETIDPTELDLINGQINDIYEAIGLGDIDYDDLLDRVENLENESENYVTTNTKQTITATKTIDLPMDSADVVTGIEFVAKSGGGVSPHAIVFKKDGRDDTTASVIIGLNSITIRGKLNYSAGYGTGDGDMSLQNSALIPNNIEGTNINDLDLGNSTYKWKDLYLSNELKDGTNNVSIADIPTTIETTVDPTNYVMTTNLKNASGTVVSTGTVDLPLESVVVSGSYDDVSKEVVLTLQNGNEVRFSVADLVSGLVSQTDFDSFVANTPQLDTANTFTQTQTFDISTGETYNSGVTFNLLSQGGSLPSDILFTNSMNSNIIRLYHNYNNNLYLSSDFDPATFDIYRVLKIIKNTIDPGYGNIQPVVDNTTDLGTITTRFKDLYLSGNLSDGTNSISIAEIVELSENSGGVGQKYLVDGVAKGEIFNNYEDNIASGDGSHAEGFNTYAQGNYAHSEGKSTQAKGNCSHAGGLNTIAGYDYQTVIGIFNENKQTNIFEIGNGTDADNRSNAFEVTDTGIVYASGDIYSNNKILATQEFVNNLVGDIDTVLDSINGEVV